MFQCGVELTRRESCQMAPHGTMPKGLCISCDDVMSVRGTHYFKMFICLLNHL